MLDICLKTLIDTPVDWYQTAIKAVYPFIHPFIFPIEKGINDYIREKRLDPLQVILLYSSFMIILCIVYRSLKAIHNFFFGYNQKSIIAHIFSFLIKHFFLTRSLFKNETKKICEAAGKSMDKNCKNKRFVMPEKGLGEVLIKDTIREWHARDEGLSFTGKVSGCRYTEDEKLDELIRNETQNFIYHNPLHTSEFPSTRQMESELIAITCNLFHNPGYGVITTGGTESIALGVLAHRNFYRETKGITKPNVVMPNTAHVAFNKACSYFEIEVRSILVDKETLTVSVKELAKHIDENTIMLVGSFPNYAYGNVENIAEYAKLAQKRGIGMHVDCCLGGFLVAFQEDVPNMNLGDFDFRVEGVTSISCDHHKYGLAPKGVSICMFATNELRHSAYFGVSDWVGGLYITPTMSGSRTAAPIVGAWISIMYNGREKFIKNAIKIQNAIEELKDGIRTQFSQEFELKGSDVSVCCFGSRIAKLNIYELNDYLHKKKGWTLSAVQKPPAIHCSMTLKIANNIQLLLSDLRECVDYCLANPKTTKGSTVELYGASVLIPDNAALEEVMKGFVDVFIGMK